MLIWLAVAGVAILLQAHPLLFHAVQYLGAACLIWIGMSLLLRTRTRTRRAAPWRGVARAGPGVA